MKRGEYQKFLRQAETRRRRILDHVTKHGAKDAARRFGISHQRVYQIINGR